MNSLGFLASVLLQLTDASHTTLQLLSATVAYGLTAVTIILVMSLGLILPKLAIDYFSKSSEHDQSAGEQH